MNYLSPIRGRATQGELDLAAFNAKMESITARIYYARIAMNNDAVVKCLNEIDAAYRDTRGN